MVVKRNDWTKEEILSLLDRNSEFVCKALLKLYEYQTQAEQNQHSTIVRNGVGFNGFDSECLSSFAEWAKKHNNSLSQKMTAVARKKLRKYAGQIVRISNGKI